MARMFNGLLALANKPTVRTPTGARGHRVRLKAAAIRAALPTLVGKDLRAAPLFDGHACANRIGTITLARLRTTEERDIVLEISGFLSVPELPDVRDLALSYEITAARVTDINASVWEVIEFSFVGAAVVRRDKAACPETWLRIQ